MQNNDWHTLFQAPKKTTAITETVCLTVLGVLLGYGFMREAPYFTAQGFSWLMLGPLLSGLRYGFVYALSSVISLGILVVMANQNKIAWAQGETMPLLMGLLFVAVAAGEFRDYWYRRLKRLDAIAHYLDERVVEVSRAFNMLKHSHDRLEQLMASRTSLRDSLLSIRRQILLSQSDGEGKDLGMLILKSLAEFGSLQGASLHAIDPMTQKINTSAMASIGHEVSLNVNNPLIQKMLRERQTISLKLDLIAQHEEELLLAIPLIDVYGKMWGMVAVNKMPFRVFKEDNIQLLSILSGYIGDLVRIRMQLKRHVGHEDMLYFYVQVLRCREDVINHNIPACLLGMACTEPQNAPQFMQLVHRHRRDLEQMIVLPNTLGNQVVLTIFPLTNMKGIESYMENFNAAFKNEFNLDASGIRYHKIYLTADMDLDIEMKSLAKDLQLSSHFFEADPNNSN